MTKARPNSKKTPAGRKQSLLRNKTKPKMHWMMPALVLLAIPLIFAFRPIHASTLSFPITADASLRLGTPTSNYGSVTSYKVDHSPIENFVLKFSITGTAGQTISSAKLRLYNSDPSSGGGSFHRMSDTSWAENTITWANAPAADTASLATLGAVSSGRWYEVDISSLVKGDGTYAIRADSTNDDGASYSSREGANPPQVVLTVLPPATPIPSTLSTPTPTTASGCVPTQTVPTNTDPGTVVLADNFESSDFSKWTSVTQLGDATTAVKPGIFNSAQCGARISVTASSGSQGNILKALPATSNEVWASGWFDVTREGASTSSNVPTMRLFNGTTRLFDVSRQNGSGGLFARWPSATGQTIIDLGKTTVINQGYNVKIHLIVNGSQSQAQVWLNGVQIFDRSSAATGYVDLSTNMNVTNFMVGAEHYAQDGDFVADDVIVKTVVPGTPTPTPLPTPTPTVSTSGQSASSAYPCVGAAAPAQWKHVVVLMFENKSYNDVIGSSAPFITGLTQKCGTYTNWKDANYKVDGTLDGNYYSKPNYATLTSGVSPSVHGLKDDTYSATTNVDNIFNRLRLAGKTTKSYQPGGSASCATSNFSGAYHDAMRFFNDVGGQSSSSSTFCNMNDRWIGYFMTDVNAGNLPAFSMVYPNNSQNMHDNSVSSGDSWASSFLTPLFDSAQYKSGDTAVFFMWDEDTPIPNAFMAPSIKPGSRPTTTGNPISHFSALRTWQEMLGISPLLGDTGQAPSLLSFFNGQ